MLIRLVYKLPKTIFSNLLWDFLAFLSPQAFLPIFTKVHHFKLYIDLAYIQGEVDLRRCGPLLMRTFVDDELVDYIQTG